MSRSVRALFVVATLGLTACSTSFVSTKTADPVLLEGQDVAEVRAAIIRAMKSRKFRPEREEPGLIMARLERGDVTIQVAIEYSSTQFVIRYLSSVGLETTTVEGETLVDDEYSKYTNKLAAVIEKELQRPAKERDQRERERREYELMLARAKAGTDRQPEGGTAEPGEPSGPDVGNIIQQVAPLLPAPPTVEVDNSVRHSEQSLTCCINGSKYVCPSQDAFKACMTSGPSECTPAGGC